MMDSPDETAACSILAVSGSAPTLVEDNVVKILQGRDLSPADKVPTQLIGEGNGKKKSGKLRFNV